MTRREGGQEVCTGRLLCEHLSGSAHDPVFPGTTEGINSLVPGPRMKMLPYLRASCSHSCPVTHVTLESCQSLGWTNHTGSGSRWAPPNSPSQHSPGSPGSSPVLA